MKTKKRAERVRQGKREVGELKTEKRDNKDAWEQQSQLLKAKCQQKGMIMWMSISNQFTCTIFIHKKRGIIEAIHSLVPFCSYAMNFSEKSGFLIYLVVVLRYFWRILLAANIGKWISERQQIKASNLTKWVDGEVDCTQKGMAGMYKQIDTWNRLNSK